MTSSIPMLYSIDFDFTKTLHSDYGAIFYTTISMVWIKLMNLIK